LKVGGLKALKTGYAFKDIGGNQNNYFLLSALNAKGESASSQEYAFSPYPVAPVVNETTTGGNPTLTWRRCLS